MTTLTTIADRLKDRFAARAAAPMSAEGARSALSLLARLAGPRAARNGRGFERAAGAGRAGRHCEFDYDYYVALQERRRCSGR